MQKYTLDLWGRWRELEDFVQCFDPAEYVDHDAYDDYIDETTEVVNIWCMEYPPSRVLKEVDPIAYNVGFNDWTANMDPNDFEEYRNAETDRDHLISCLDELIELCDHFGAYADFGDPWAGIMSAMFATAEYVYFERGTAADYHAPYHAGICDAWDYQPGASQRGPNPDEDDTLEELLDLLRDAHDETLDEWCAMLTVAYEWCKNSGLGC